MRLSVCLDPRRSWADTLALVRHAEVAGLHGVWVCDHFMPYDVAGRSVAGSVLEGWSTLAAVAVATSRVRLGTLVLGATYRHPAVVAGMAATLDQVSDGRLTLGLGAGWQENEHTAYGIDLPPPGRRLTMFAEYCAVVRSRLHGSSVTLLVGGGGEQRTLRIAARHADAWHVWGPAERFAGKSAVLTARCAEIGRDPSSIQRLSGEVVEPGVTAADAALLLAGYRAAGADELVVRDHADHPVDAARRTLDLVTAAPAG